MTTLSILSKEDVAAFESPPVFTSEDRKYFFSPPQWAHELLTSFPTAANKLVFLLQLGYFRASKKFYSPHNVPEADIAFVTARFQLGNGFDLRHFSKTTLHRHRALIRERLGYQPFAALHAIMLAQEIDFLLSKQGKMKDIFTRLLQLLEQQRVEIPPYNTLALLITSAFRAYEKRLLSAVNASLHEKDKELLDSLLETDIAYRAGDKQALKLKRYALTLLKRPRQSTRPKKIRENIHDLKIIEEMFAQLQPVIAELRLSPEMIRQYATVALKVQIPQLARRDQKRYLYLLCFITHQYYTLQDILIDILLKVVQTAENAAKRTQQEAYFHTRTDRSRAVLELTKAFESSHERWLAVRRVVLSQSLSASQKLRRLEVLVREEDGERQATIQGPLRAVRRDNQWIQNDGDSSDALEEQSLWLQKRATEIIKHLIFNQATSRKGVIEAIVYFRGHDAKLSMDAPTAFLTKKERQVVFDAHHRLRVSLYKALLFQHIAVAMKAGALNLTYSYRYRSLDDYLIPKTLWTQNRTPYVERAHLTGFADCEATLSDLRKKLDRQFATTNTHILAGINSYITVHGHHQFTLTTPREENVAEPPVELFPQARFVSLCEVLATVQHATGFLDAFSHVQLTHTHQKPPDKVFFAGITGLGCNIGIAKLAKISIHINQAVLERAVNWYFSAETVAAANDRLLSFMERLALPRIFDRSDGIRITTSDGQKYTLDGESLTASRSYKYFGKDPGITAYTFRNNRDFLYHSTVFSPTDREAWYVIDGMMHNEVVKSDMHATDTHGATPPTFAALHFLQVFFAPRLADLPKRTRYAFVKRKVYQEKGCPILPDKMINSDIIREHWDDILRFMATIILKETQASQLFQRLNSYSHQHPLYRALKEFGQIIETVFILRYIDEENMRQAVEKELNKLEHTNKFAKAVFHGGNQEFSQETREEQLIAEGCKRLIANAIILWNYLYLSEKIADTPEGKQRRELLRHIQHSSMATWHHINLLGEYDYSDERVNDITPFHLPKILALKVA